MKKSNFIITAAIILICGYASSFAQWQLQKKLSGQPMLFKVSTLSRDVAWIVGQGTQYVYRTTNGGKTWIVTARVKNTTGDQCTTGEALDSTTAFVGTANSSVNAGIYRTKDGGQSWQRVYLPTGTKNNYWDWIHFFNAQNGIAECYQETPGQNFLIVKTTDGGDTWTPIANQPYSDQNEVGLQNAVYFYDNLNGWFGTVNSGRAFRTTDGGNTWNGFNSGNTGVCVWAVRFISPMVGIRTSLDSPPYLTRSTDGGQTWTPVSNLPVSDIQGLATATSVSTPSINQLWVYGESGETFMPFILTSIDDGVTWQEQTTPDLLQTQPDFPLVYHMSAVSFGALKDSVQAFAVSLKGQILNYREKIGFVTAVNEKRPNLPLEYTLSQNYPNPFNPQTTIAFVLAAHCKVTLTIYDALGQEVEKLVDMEMPPGFHQAVWKAKNHTSGVYFYRLTTENFSQLRKMVLLR